MAKLSQTYLGYSPAQIDNISAQKADTLTGFWVIMGAFLIQIISQMFIKNDFFILGYWRGVIVLFMAVIVFLIIIINNIYCKYQQQEIKKAIVKSRLLQIFKDKITIDDNYGKSIIKDGKFLFGSDYKVTNYKEALEELSVFLKIEIPKDIQFK